MEIIKKEDAQQLSFFAKGRESALGTWIRKLQVGEALKISHSDWKGKQPPYYIANYITKKQGWTFHQGKLPNNEGWVIMRLS